MAMADTPSDPASLVTHIIGKLKPRYREPLLLLLVGRFPPCLIADLLQLPLDQVLLRIHQGLHEIQRQLIGAYGNSRTMKRALVAFLNRERPGKRWHDRYAHPD
jgi:DNA-directed RNA polymerase specialized sigma24 family protein